MADETIDAALTALFAVPDPAPDPAFVARVDRAVRAEQAVRAARAGAWRRFRGEALATLTVTGVFALLWRFAGALGPDGRAVSAIPATAAFLMLGLWGLVAFRPGVMER